MNISAVSEETFIYRCAINNAIGGYKGDKYCWNQWTEASSCTRE